MEIHDLTALFSSHGDAIQIIDKAATNVNK